MAGHQQKGGEEGGLLGPLDAKGAVWERAPVTGQFLLPICPFKRPFPAF